MTVRRPPESDDDLYSFVESIADEHPPLSLDTVDLTVRDRDGVRQRFGTAINYLSRVELEVERNVLELRTMLVDPSDADRLFFEDVWSPQELQHGLILDAVSREIGLTPEVPNVDEVSSKIRFVGLLSRLPGMNAVVRMLYYLTGVATERAAVVAYSRLLSGLRSADERALVETVVKPIRRQEPSHFVFYRRSAEAVVHREGLRPWQVFLTRLMRRQSFGLVGANNETQRRQFGELMAQLDIDDDARTLGQQLGFVERELLWANDEGLDVPPYILAAIQEAIDLHAAA